MLARHARSFARRARLVSWCLATVGIGAALVALVLDRDGARSSAAQVWSPFVLVTGLLLVGLVADDDGLFAAIGYRLAILAPNDIALFGGAAIAIAVVTALLNLDTSVVFLTPVLVHAASSRSQRETSLLIACLLLSNAGSLLLPGSNLTNLIVLGHLHLSGGQFLHRMALPWIASVLVTGSLIGLIERRKERRQRSTSPPVVGRSERTRPDRLRGQLGMAAVLAVTVLVITLRSPALPVLAVGVAVVVIRLIAHREQLSHVLEVISTPWDPR